MTRWFILAIGVIFVLTGLVAVWTAGWDKGWDDRGESARHIQAASEGKEPW